MNGNTPTRGGGGGAFVAATAGQGIAKVQTGGRGEGRPDTRFSFRETRGERGIVRS